MSARIAVAGFVAGRVGWLDGTVLAEVLVPAPKGAVLVLIGAAVPGEASAAVSLRLHRGREL